MYTYIIHILHMQSWEQNSSLSCSVTSFKQADISIETKQFSSTLGADITRLHFPSRKVFDYIIIMLMYCSCAVCLYWLKLPCSLCILEILYMWRHSTHPSIHQSVHLSIHLAFLQLSLQPHVDELAVQSNRPTHSHSHTHPHSHTHRHPPTISILHPVR